jgi:hypothetical protein
MDLSYDWGYAATQLNGNKPGHLFFTLIILFDRAGVGRRGAVLEIGRFYDL